MYVQGEEVKPFEVAIDRPSSKFLGFLKKHYDLHSSIDQVGDVGIDICVSLAFHIASIPS